MARATQLGVKEGALGLAEVREGKALLDTFWYDSEVPLGLLSFEAGECLFSRAKCEALLEEMAPPEEEEREEEPGPIGARVVEEGVE